MKKEKVILGFALIFLALGAAIFPASILGQEKTPSRLAVVWTSGDPDITHQVCFMYTTPIKNLSLSLIL